MSDETQAVLDRVRADFDESVIGEPIDANDVRNVLALVATVDALREDARRDTALLLEVWSQQAEPATRNGWRYGITSDIDSVALALAERGVLTKHKGKGWFRLAARPLTETTDDQ